MGDLFLGGVVGAVTNEGLKAGLELSYRAISYDDNRRGFESRVNSIKSLIGEIEEIGTELGTPEEEIKKFTDRLQESQKLVGSCLKTSFIYFWKRASKSKKIKKMDDSLVNFCQTYVQLLLARDSKKHEARLNEIYAILDELRNDRRVCGPSVFGSPCGAPEAPGFIVGKDMPLHELKMRLLKDQKEEDAQVVVLSAPGGCGKTTLASIFCHDVNIKDIFKDNIFFVKFSKTPDVKVIVQKMFQHKNFQVPKYEDDDEAIIQLENLLKKIGPYPILLVLDDAWPGSESLIQKFKKRIPGYRILVTSRCEFPRFDSTYKLKPLSDEDAMDLFCHSALPHGRSINMPGELEQIVKGCGGFPLALTVVGGSLCGQPEVNWELTLKQRSQGQSIFDSNNDLLISLQTSVDALGEKTIVKECFLDLGSFPEDQRIPATSLIDIGVELYDLDEKHALANIYQLSTRNLVDLVLTRKDAIKVDGNEHFVMLHDLLRELAIHQSSQEPVEQRKRLIMEIRENNLPKWSIEQMQRPFQARLLSISTDENFSSSWFNIHLPETKVLILNFKTKNYSLPEFMEKMDQLKVLIISNYGFCPAKLSNSPLLGSLSGLKRIKLEKVSVSSLSKSTLQFRNLRKISLIMCEIGEAFTNCTMDIPHMFPNLVEIDFDCCIDLVKLPEGLCDIACLEKLSITKCHDLEELPEGLGRLTSLEMLRLHACTELLGLPESIGSLHKLSVLDISDCLSMSELPIGISGLCGLERLDMRGCEFGMLPPSIKDLLQLKEVICNKEASDLWEPFKTHLTNLKINALDEDINLDWLPNRHF